jgi:hypothetical protein
LILTFRNEGFGIPFRPFSFCSCRPSRRKYIPFSPLLHLQGKALVLEIAILQMANAPIHIAFVQAIGRVMTAAIVSSHTLLANPSAVTSLSSSTTLSSQRIARGQWQFYTIPTTGGSLIITVNQTLGGDVDLYLLQNQFPTKTTFAYKDTTTAINFGITVQNAGTAVWYIGVGDDNNRLIISSMVT